MHSADYVQGPLRDGCGGALASDSWGRSQVPLSPARAHVELARLLAFLREHHGPLTRVTTYGHPQGTCWTIVTDASPWGMGGVLYADGTPVEYWADKVTAHACSRN